MKYRTSNYAADVYYYFFFESNLQGDIVAIYNEAGEKIGDYLYDAFGNVNARPTSGITSLESMVLNRYNPFRYRSYYYDWETGWYYLQSRYYNPNWGRFLNVDSLLSQGSVLGNNMFAYCLNNPVNMADTTGQLPFFLVTAAIGAVVGGAIGAFGSWVGWW